MPSTLRSCEKCTGRFAPQYFQDSPMCRLCVTHSLVVKELTNVRNRCAKLEKEYETLRDFVTANVGVANVVPAIQAANAEPADATPQGRDLNVNLPQELDVTVDPSHEENLINGTPQELPFITVRNGVRPQHR